LPISHLAERCRRSNPPVLGEQKGTTVALLVTVSIVVVILVILLFAGCKWVKPQLLRLEVANWLKFELRSSEQQEPPEQPKRAIKRS
jgi:hypothetical protein